MNEISRVSLILLLQRRWLRGSSGGMLMGRRRCGKTCFALELLQAFLELPDIPV